MKNYRWDVIGTNSSTGNPELIAAFEYEVAAKRFVERLEAGLGDYYVDVYIDGMSAYLGNDKRVGDIAYEDVYNEIFYVSDIDDTYPCGCCRCCGCDCDLENEFDMEDKP